MAATFKTFKDTIARRINEKGWAIIGYSNEDYGRHIKFYLKKNNRNIEIMVNVVKSIHLNKVICWRVKQQADRA